MEAKKAKIEWLDIAKAIAIILVIIGHAFRDEMRSDVYSYDVIFSFIYRFHMPLWFFLAGCTYGFNRKKYKSRSAGAFIGTRAKRLLIPLVVYSALMYVMFYACSRIPSVSAMLEDSSYALVSIRDYLWRTFVIAENPYAIHVWYLEVLFIIGAVVFLIDRMFYDEKSAGFEMGMLAAIIIVWRLIFDNMPGLSYPWIIVAIMRDTPWYILGILVIMHMDRIVNMPGALKIMIFLLSALYMVLRVTALKDDLDDMTARIWIQAVEYFAAAGLIFSVVFAADAVTRRWKGKIKNAASYIGKKSFSVYLLHQPMCAFIGTVLYNKMHINSLAVIFICIIMSIVVPLIILKIIKILHLGKFFKAILNLDVD